MLKTACNDAEVLEFTREAMKHYAQHLETEAAAADGGLTPRTAARRYNIRYDHSKLLGLLFSCAAHESITCRP